MRLLLVAIAAGVIVLDSRKQPAVPTLARPATSCSRFAVTPASQTPPFAAVVISTAERGANAKVTARAKGTRLIEIRGCSSGTFTTRDGRSLSATNIRAGDNVLVRSDERITDVSQVCVDLTGVVVDPLNRKSSPPFMVVMARSYGGIVVDVTERTHISALSGTSGPLIAEADLVRLHGVLDLSHFEMTQVDSVTRLGP